MFPKGTKNLCLEDAFVCSDFVLVALERTGDVDILT
jgi:hypothetical protein